MSKCVDIKALSVILIFSMSKQASKQASVNKHANSQQAAAATC